ncbi:FGGY-family carbohydrate kinase [Paenibacillaceae bacterium WGS1546]|uniref:FGGY-family carbohydrate kinase n=1 Tax=Cohnella sp. WGS1546 TaxID=3366810 RepID=UPI00372CFED8
MEVLLGIDIGTYSVKATAIAADGVLLDTVSLRHEVSIPKPGYAEQHPEQVWWHGLESAVRQLVSRGRFSPERVRALGVSTLSPCVAPVDDAGRAVRPAILYGVDVRAGRQIDRLNEELGDAFVLERYGQYLSSQTAGPKIMWLRDEEPSVFRASRRFVPASTYLVHRLTGKWTIDAYIAPSYAPFFRMDAMEWDGEMIARYLGEEGERLQWPELAWPGDAAGELLPGAASALGLPPGIPVAVGSADALTEAISAAALSPGDLFVMYGSSIFFIATTSRRVSSSKIFWPSPGLSPGTWAVAGGMSTAGTLVRWVMDLAYPSEASFGDFFAEAKRSEPGSGGLVMLPYMSGERTPLADPDARGLIAGLSLKHGRAELSRAALEGVAYGIRHNLEAFEDQVGPVRLVGAGGGVTDPFWPQIVSDVCARPQRIMPYTSSAIGDALLAGRCAGLYGEERMREMALSLCRPVELQPNAKLSELYDSRYEVYRKLYEETRESVHRLARG